MVSLSDLQPLHREFRNLPFQAINAKIANVVPVTGDWLPEDTAWFNTRVAEKQFVSLIKAIDCPEADPLVELVLVDTTHPSEDKYIDQELVQVNNELSLFQIILFSLYFRMGEQKRPDQDQELILTMLVLCPYFSLLLSNDFLNLKHKITKK